MRLTRTAPALICLWALLALPSVASATTRAPVRRVTVRLLPASGMAAHRRLTRANQQYRVRVRNAKLYRAQKAAAQREYQRYSRRHRRARASSATAARPTLTAAGATNAPGLDAPHSGGPTPPDTTGAIGPNYYVELVNSEIAVYPRGSLLSTPVTESEAGFVGAPGAGTCDGNIQWDQHWQRWLYSVLDCNAAVGAEQLFFGWSRTADPTDLTNGWCRYSIPTGTEMEDFPKLGHDDGQIFIGANGYDDGSMDYMGSRIFIVTKPASPESCPANVGSGAAEYTVSASDFTPVPANIADSSQTGYVVTTNDDNAHLDLYTIASDGTVGGPASVSVPPFYIPANVPQPGTGNVIDSSDTRLTQAVAVTDPSSGTEGIWTQHAIATGGDHGVAVVRWYEITPGATSPRQLGTIDGPSGTFAFNGAVSPTADGTSAAVIYNSGDGSHLVDLRAQDRSATTPLGQTTNDQQLAQSSTVDGDFSCVSPYGPPCRWGDYAGASPDPANATLVWGTGELTTLGADVNSDAQWGSENVAVSTLPPPAVATSAATSIGTTGATVNGIVNPESHDTTYYFEYGTSSGYGTVTAATEAGSSNADVPVSANLTGLMPGTTYHFALVARNLYGTSTSNELMFTTAAPAPPTVRISSPAARGVYTVGQVVATRFSCTDSAGAPGIRLCADSNGSRGTSGTGHLDTRTTGTHFYYVTAVSLDGQNSSARLVYSVRRKPAVSILTKSASTARRHAKVNLTCSAGTGDCRGRLSLTVRVRQRVRRRVGGRSDLTTITTTVTLGSATYSVRSGKRAAFTLALSRTAISMLGRTSNHRLSVVATATVQSGSNSTRTVTLTR